MIPHQKSRQTRGVYNQAAHRVREIERIIQARYGAIPDTDDADVILEPVACAYAQILRTRHGRAEFKLLIDRVGLWCDRWAPEVSIKVQRAVCSRALKRLRNFTADEAAEQLQLSYDERMRLKITTIGAFDVSKKQRDKLYKDRKKERDRKRAAKKRALKGSIPRSEYISGSLSARRPWEAEGISRRTWERRRRNIKIDASASPTDAHNSESVV